MSQLLQLSPAIELVKLLLFFTIYYKKNPAYPWIETSRIGNYFQNVGHWKYAKIVYGTPYIWKFAIFIQPFLFT